MKYVSMSGLLVVIGSWPQFHSFRSEINKPLLRHQVPHPDQSCSVAISKTSALAMPIKSNRKWFWPPLLKFISDFDTSYHKLAVLNLKIQTSTISPFSITFRNYALKHPQNIMEHLNDSAKWGDFWIDRPDDWVDISGQEKNCTWDSFSKSCAFRLEVSWSNSPELKQSIWTLLREFSKYRLTYFNCKI